MMYIADALAAQGYVVASVRQNAINCLGEQQDNLDIDARARLAAEHLKVWVTRRNDTLSPYFHRIDLGNVAVIGHSRGADGAALAAQYVNSDASAPGARVSSVFQVAPAGFTYYKLGGAALGMLRPGCDGDVPLLRPLVNFDAMFWTGYEPAPLGGMWYLEQANHTGFNTAWNAPDQLSYDSINSRQTGCPQATIDSESQRAALVTLLPSWLRATTSPTGLLSVSGHLTGEVSALPLTVSGLEVRSRYIQQSDTLVARFGFEVPQGNASMQHEPAETRLEASQDFVEPPQFCAGRQCAPNFANQDRVLKLTWRNGTASWVRFNRESSADQAFSHVVFDVTPLSHHAAEFEVTVSDGTSTASTRVKNLREANPAYSDAYVLQTVRLPARLFSGVDLARTRSIQFTMKSNEGVLALARVALAR